MTLFTPKPPALYDNSFLGKVRNGIIDFFADGARFWNDNSTSFTEASLENGILNNFYDDKIREEAQAYNSAEAKAQREWASHEAELNRIFQQTSAEKANAFTANENAINREFQERMSNTAYQRAVADLRAAGLNPLLAYAQGGASSPSGSSGSGASASGSTVSGSSANSGYSLSSKSSAEETFDLFGGLISSIIKALK
ncbi:MAG: hypothetical protein J6B80_02895 [Clostridia bacterium]|nr:hypothetical protein [Clostridia bacterium]